jgi:hypothetical protein
MYVMQETDRLLGQQYTDTDSGFYNKVIGVVFACTLYRVSIYLLVVTCTCMYLGDSSAVGVIIRL